MRSGYVQVSVSDTFYSRGAVPLIQTTNFHKFVRNIPKFPWLWLIRIIPLILKISYLYCHLNNCAPLFLFFFLTHVSVWWWSQWCTLHSTSCPSLIHQTIAELYFCRLHELEMYWESEVVQGEQGWRWHSSLWHCTSLDQTELHLVSLAAVIHDYACICGWVGVSRSGYRIVLGQIPVTAPEAVTGIPAGASGGFLCGLDLCNRMSTRLELCVRFCLFTWVHYWASY